MFLLWHTLYAWNSLDINIRQTTTLRQFKTMAKAITCRKANKLYDMFLSKSSVHHARMRMGLSALNSHRKAYHFIDHDSCPLCGMSPENTLHFFLLCPHLATYRNVLMRDIAVIFTSYLTDIDLHTNTLRTRNEVVSILLYGSNLLSLDNNVLIFQAVNQFILNSKRFA